jgi:hypothetical protein
MSAFAPQHEWSLQTQAFRTCPTRYYSIRPWLIGVNHTAYLVTVVEGAPSTYPDSFDEHLEEDVDDLESSFEVFISDKR